MNLDAAFSLFGLDREATVADLRARYRALRKPLLKRLNRAEPGAEPPELVTQLEGVETAFKLLQQELEQSAPAAQEKPQGRRSTGRVTLETGAVLLGRYEIKGLATHRPEGDTYRVFDRIRQAELGLKIVDEALLRGKGRRSLLHRGLLDAGRLNHHGLARVLDIHRLQHTYAVTQELPGGTPLWNLLYGDEATRKPISPRLVLKIAEQATRTLSYVHTLMPHGALRPESIWVADPGDVRVADLGFVDLQGPMRAKRLSRAKLGTAYWAPEQFQDEHAAQAESDQYALALMCYEAITGEPASGRIGRIKHADRAYPRRFVHALERALSSKPARRFPDMDAFGEAAFPRYQRERVRPTAVSPGARLIPAIVLLLAVAGFALSPFGRSAAAKIGALAADWRASVQQTTADQVELRRLRDIVARLDQDADTLDEASQSELERLSGLLNKGEPGGDERAAIQRDLTQVLRQVVASSRHRAEKSLERALASLDALRSLRTAQARRAGERADARRRGLASQQGEERDRGAVAWAREVAASERLAAAWDDALQALDGSPALLRGFHALFEAEAALAIGDDTATGRAYDAAQASLDEAAAAAEALVGTQKEQGAWLDAEPAPAPDLRGLDREACSACMETYLDRAEDLSASATLVNVLETQRGEAMAQARAAWVVSEDGFWALALEGTARRSTLVGTWRERAGLRTLRILYWDGEVLERPVDVVAERGGDRPVLADLRAALARVPRNARGMWSVRRSGVRPLPAPKLEDTERVLRAGEVDLRATLPATSRAGLVSGAGRFEGTEGAFALRARVPGDVLRTWLRAHAVSGLRSSPAAWLSVRVDGLKPRVHLLQPRPDATLEPGQEVEVRLFAYDANLRVLELQGEAQELRRDDVYVLVQKRMRAPETGALKLPVRAVDAAGNETVVEWTWNVR